MEIVLGMYRLHDPGGTEHYTLIVAEQLQRLGHVVTIFVEETGAMAELARSRGLRLAAREDELPDDVDVLYAQESITAYRLTARYPKAPLVYGLHAVDYDLSVPPQLPELVSAYVTAHDRISRRAQAFAVTAEVVRLRQPVDLARFTPRANLSEPPRRLLALGNYLHGDRARVIEDACARAGIEVLRVGAQNGDRVLEAERVLNDVDIVVGKARVIVEAMACGRAAYVFDTFGSDGWVTKDSYARLEADNFSGQTGTPPVDVAQLSSDLELYRPDMGAANRELAVVNHSANTHAVELVELFERLAPRRASAATPLRELSRLVRVQWQTEERAMSLAAEMRSVREENEQLRHRLGELEPLESLAARVPELERYARELAESLREASESLRSVLSQRRVRFGIALGRPLDLLRRLRR
jgi:hypothetical protein